MALQYFWGLWSARRSDLQAVYDAGFRGVRPPYPDTPQPCTSPPAAPEDRTDTYATAAAYAAAARDIGFTKLIYEFNLPWLWNEFNQDMQAVKTEITRHIGEMSEITGIACQPYVDEPESWSDFGGRPCARPEPPGTKNYDQTLLDRYSELITYIKNEASNRNTHLIIATDIRDIVCCCDVFHENCSQVVTWCRENWSSYYYNRLGLFLMLTNYLTAQQMSQLMPAARSNYPGQNIQQLINFFDRTAARVSPTVDELKAQINLNSQYTAGENWFFAGDTIGGNCPSKSGDSNSQTQWSRLIEAIQFFGVPSPGN